METNQENALISCSTQDKLDIASQRSLSPDGTWLKRDIQSIMFSCFQYIKCENISKKAKNGLGEVLWRSVDDLQ